MRPRSFGGPVALPWPCRGLRGSLLAALKNPGTLQSDLLAEVGGVKDTALSRQLDILECVERPGFSVTGKRLVRREKNPRYRASNDIYLTEEGERFARDFATYFNDLIDGVSKK